MQRSVIRFFPGAEVVLFENADKAWQHIAGFAGKIDLIFSDIDMPGKMNGLGLLREVKKILPGVAFISSSGKHEMLTIAEGLGADEILPKPFFPSKIKEIIERFAEITN